MTFLNVDVLRDDDAILKVSKRRDLSVACVARFREPLDVDRIVARRDELASEQTRQLRANDEARRSGDSAIATNWHACRQRSALERREDVVTRQLVVLSE